MRIDNELKTFFDKNKLSYEVETEEHPACWGKDCEGEHLVKELKVWRPGKKQFRLSFANGCSNRLIMEACISRKYANPLTPKTN